LTYRCVGKKVVTVECSDDEEDAEEENFFRREEISRAPGGAVESGRSDGMLSSSLTFLPPANAPGFLRPPASRGGLRKPGSVLLNEKDFLPIGGWAARWCGDVEG
jgi:hypothetical protein